LYRLTPWDFASQVNLLEHRPLDLGNLRITGTLEETQQNLGVVIGAVLRTAAVPIVLGGGHETAYGHYLGYLAAGKQVGIINLDAHLDVRPSCPGQGHSGSPFRQALEHPEQPLPGQRYICLGAQPHVVSQAHFRFVRERGSIIGWAPQVRRFPQKSFRRAYQRLAPLGPVYVSLDADVVRSADVPSVSAPNPSGLAGHQVIALARLAGALPQVASFDLVEINPSLDRDGQSVRWAAVAVWNFLIGLASRTNPGQIT
jgi:formiminoglutamase